MQTVTFNDLLAPSCCPPLPTSYAGITWSGGWLLSGPFGAFNTVSVSGPASVGQTYSSFALPLGRIFQSVRAYNGGGGSATISFACSGMPTVVRIIPAQTLATITTGWTVPCPLVTFGSSIGWNVNLDDILIGP